jgi:DNA polymerase
MEEAFRAIAEELKRLRAEGEENIPVDESALRVIANLARAKNGLSASEEPEKIDFASKIEFKPENDMAKKANPGAKVKIVTSKGEMEIAPIPDPTPFELPAGDKKAKWDFLRNLVLSDETCKAHLKPEKNIVFGVGSLDADIFFCGEAPGADEEIQGEPFVGKAGQLLTKIIAAMGLKREDVYIGNIMNWRPELPTKTGNRPPTQEEMDYCLPYLKAQIEIINPKVVVALGNTAVSGLLGPDPKRRMGAIRGQWQKFGGRDLMVTYHPSFLLQYANAQKKREVWEDMLAVMERVGLPISDKQRAYFT